MVEISSVVENVVVMWHTIDPENALPFPLTIVQEMLSRKCDKLHFLCPCPLSHVERLVQVRSKPIINYHHMFSVYTPRR